MPREQRRQITSSMAELQEQMSRLVLAQPHQSDKSRLARELASQVSSYLENKTPEEAMSPSKKEKPIQSLSALLTSSQIQRSKTPLQFSELVDLLSTLSQKRVVRQCQLQWQSRTSRDGGLARDLGKITVELWEGPLLGLDFTLLQHLLNTCLDWTREVGGNVTMQFAVEREVELGGFRPSDNDLAELIEERGIEIEPSPNDPPGVQLGLVKRYL